MSGHHVNYFGREWKGKFNKWWFNVTPTSAIRVERHSFRDCSNPFPSLHGFEQIFRWISLKGSLNMEGRQWSWLWLIASPNIVIFVPSAIHISPPQSQNKIMDQIFLLHGIPSSIVSNRDATFISHFWTKLFLHNGTKLNMSLGYHPQTDGQTKVINKCLETYIRCFIS